MIIRVLFGYLVGFISLVVKFVLEIINVKNLFFFFLRMVIARIFSMLIVDKLYESLYSNCFVALKVSASALVLIILFW